MIMLGIISILNRNYSDTGSSESDNINSAKKININTGSGTISVNNFKKKSQVLENGFYLFVDKEKYNISYDPQYDGFIVTLLVNQDIENTRKEAENDLINSLEISEEDACKLNVFLYVSAALTTNEDLYQNHGLGFCSDGKKFN
jgi:hypothetical protein